MGIFKRIKNIVISNMNYGKELDIETDSKEEKVSSEKEPEISINNTDDKKYYDILEVGYDADFKQIKAQYKKLLKKYHPDFYGKDKEKYEKAVLLSKKINEAYSYFERKNS